MLATRLDPTLAVVLVERIEERLTPPPEQLATLELPLEDFMPEEERGDDSTEPLIRLQAPVTVSVLSEGRGFAQRLLTALGDNRVEPHAHADPRKWPTPEPPRVVVLDASDFPREGTPASLVEWSEGLPPATVRVLWAQELPYGKSFKRAVGGATHPWVTFSSSEGIAPLLDLIRSRRRGE